MVDYGDKRARKDRFWFVPNGNDRFRPSAGKALVCPGVHATR